MAQNTRKLVGVILMLAMLVSAIAALTVTASAANQVVAEFTLGANGSASHNDGSEKTSYTETVNGYTLSLTSMSKVYTGARDAKGNSCIKLGTSSAAGKFTLNVPADVVEVTIYAAKYKTNTSKLTVAGTTHTLTKASNNGEYDEIVVDTTSNKTISVTTVSGGYRVMINGFKFSTAESTGCEHPNLKTETNDATCEVAGSIVSTCPDCTYTATEVIPALGHTGGEATCEELAECTRCGEGYGKTLPHSFVDRVCEDCGEVMPNEATIDFSTTNHRVSLSTTSQVWTNDGLTVTNNKAGSTNNVANYSNPIRFYKSSTVVIAFPGMTSISINAGTGDYATPWETMLNTISGATVTVENGVYTATFAAPVDEITLTCPAQVRANSITVTAPAGNPECTHANTVTETIDPTCTEAGVVITKCADENCGAIVETTEGAAALGHLDTNGDYQCEREDCGKVATPAADSALTIEQALALGALTTTADKYYLTGTITGFYGNGGLTYGNIYITDGTNTILIYGLYNYNGSVRYDAMETKPVVGDEITVYGILTSYNGVAQMKDGWLDELVQHTHSYQYDCSAACSICGGLREANHVYFYPCDPVCMICYEITNPDAAHTIVAVDAKEATCEENGNIAYWYCSDCGTAWADEALTQQTNQRNVIIPATGHEYFYPCDPVCMICYELTNTDATHTIVAVDAKAPTCTEMGNIAYWYCSDCGTAWADEALTQQTNLMSVKLPMLVAVAQIGDVKYATLQDAFNAAVDGDTIVLLADVAVDKYVDVAYQKQEGDTYDDIVARVLTLDLNGKTISTGEGYKFSNFGVIYVGLKQTLTITNGTVTCNVKNEVTVGGYGVINLENCTLINEAGAPAFCIYQSKPGDQYNGDAYGEGTYTGTGSIGEGVEIDGNIEIQGTLVLGEGEITATFKGAGVRYAKGNGDLEDPAKVSIRFGYEFSDISLVKAWGWSYSANGKTLYVDGKYAADNVTNLVLTNIPTAFLGAEITVELWYTVEIDGVDVTIYDGGNARVTADVLANTAKYDSNVNAVAYAKAALYLAGNEDYKAEYDAWIGKED